VQRLFSTFADGWPGVGILLLRLLAGITLIAFAITDAREAPPLMIGVPQIIGVVAGIFIVIGLWTPVAGMVVTLVNLWIAFAHYPPHSSDVLVLVMQAVLGGALAMIGPGAWSIDARLFGRKHIDF
jgi:putative oxidoreductase